MRILIPLLILALFAPSATAGDACDRDSPCVLAIDVDAFGIVGPDEPFNATAGDWFVLDIFSFDDAQSHTLSAPALGIDVTVSPLESYQTAPFQMVAGDHRLHDEPSGDDYVIHVILQDFIDGSSDPASEDTAAPAGLALLALAAFLRRR